MCDLSEQIKGIPICLFLLQDSTWLYFLNQIYIK